MCSTLRCLPLFKRLHHVQWLSYENYWLHCPSRCQVVLLSFSCLCKFSEKIYGQNQQRTWTEGFVCTVLQPCVYYCGHGNTLISTVSLRGLSFVSSTCALEHSLSVFTGDTHVGQVLSLTFMSLCGLCLCPFNRVLNDFTLIRSRQGFQPTDSFTISISLHKLATSDTVCKRRRHISWQFNDCLLKIRTLLLFIVMWNQKPPWPHLLWENRKLLRCSNSYFKRGQSNGKCQFLAWLSVIEVFVALLLTASQQINMLEHSSHYMLPCSSGVRQGHVSSLLMEELTSHCGMSFKINRLRNPTSGT